MKNIFLLVIMLTLSTYQLYSQIYVGAKVGLAPSLLSYESLPNHKSGLTFFNPMIGVIAEVPIVYGFSIQPEVQFVKRSTNLKAITSGDKAKSVIKQGDYFSDFSLDNLAREEDHYNGSAEPTEQFQLPDLYENMSINLNYLEGHLMFKYEFIGGGSGLYVEAGPYYAIGIGSKGTSTLVNRDNKKSADKQLTNIDGSLTENYTDLINSYTDVYKLNFEPFKGDKAEHVYKKSDLGLAFGAGLYKELGSSRMYFDLRVLMGLQNMNNKPNTSSTIKSRSVQISATYLFPLGE